MLDPKRGQSGGGDRSKIELSNSPSCRIPLSFFIGTMARVSFLKLYMIIALSKMYKIQHINPLRSHTLTKK